MPSPRSRTRRPSAPAAAPPAPTSAPAATVPPAAPADVAPPSAPASTTAAATDLPDDDDIKNIKIASQQKKGTLVGASTGGTYLHASGDASQVIAVDVNFVPGQHLEENQLYVIAAKGMPATMNMVFEHHVTSSDGKTLYVFIEQK